MIDRLKITWGGFCGHISPLPELSCESQKRKIFEWSFLDLDHYEIRLHNIKIPAFSVVFSPTWAPKGWEKGERELRPDTLNQLNPSRTLHQTTEDNYHTQGPDFLLIHFGNFSNLKNVIRRLFEYLLPRYSHYVWCVCVCSLPANAFYMRFRVLARFRFLHFFGIVFDMNEPWNLPVGEKYVLRWLLTCLVFWIFWKNWKRFVVDFFLCRATEPMNINEYFLNLVHDADRSEEQCTNQWCGRRSEWSITNNWWLMTIALNFWDKTQWSWWVKTTQIDVWQGEKNTNMRLLE